MREKQRQGWAEKGGSSFSDKTFCQRTDKFSHGIQARKTFERQCRHERRTGCLAPPPLPNSEVFCQVERGEEVIGRQRCQPFSHIFGLPSFVALKSDLLCWPIFFSLGLQGPVWRGDGQSVWLCQVEHVQVEFCPCPWFRGCLKSFAC